MLKIKKNWLRIFNLQSCGSGLQMYDEFLYSVSFRAEIQEKRLK